MSEYKGYRYEPLPDGRWEVRFPDGAILKAPKQTEENLKLAIDLYEEVRKNGKAKDGRP